MSQEFYELRQIAPMKKEFQICCGKNVCTEEKTFLTTPPVLGAPSHVDILFFAFSYEHYPTTLPRRSASSCEINSPQYSAMNVFFSTASFKLSKRHLKNSNKRVDGARSSDDEEDATASLSDAKSAAPHDGHRSGSHSRTAKKQGHCLVSQWALHRQPGKRFGPSSQKRRDCTTIVAENAGIDAKH
uniref:Uncharacterized protein n=1 Tax=Romanomermis culicivorax TaxID=13658 RepID=A0A915I037_ROMCU